MACHAKFGPIQKRSARPKLATKIQIGSQFGSGGPFLAAKFGPTALNWVLQRRSPRPTNTSPGPKLAASLRPGGLLLAAKLGPTYSRLYLTELLTVLA